MKNWQAIHVDLATAQQFVDARHRHLGAPAGHRFSIALLEQSVIRGVVCVGRPVARGLDHVVGVEVNRCCTDGTPNACSYLYGAASRAARELGFCWILTYTLDEEGGASLRASGWWGEPMERVRTTAQWASREGRTGGIDKPKWRWVKMLAEVHLWRPDASLGPDAQGRLAI